MYRVESLTRTLPIEDLGITVSPNLPKVISPEDFAKSLCLAELVRQGHLRVSRTSLCREEVPANPRLRKKDFAPESPPREAPPKKSTPPKKPFPAAKSEVSETVVGTVEQTVADTVKQTVAVTVKQTVASSLKEAIEDLVKSAVDSAIKSAIEGSIPELYLKALPPSASPPTASPAGKPVDLPVSGEAPLFIPSGIVPKGVSGEISVVSETQTSESLGDSASALKKLRKGASK